MADKINEFGWQCWFTCKNRDVREGMKYGKPVMPAVPTVAGITFTNFVGKDSSMLIKECVLGHCLLVSSCCIVDVLFILFETSKIQKLCGKRTERFEVTTTSSAA